MEILLGLTAAFCWGAADFLVRYSTRIIGTYRTLLFMQFFGLVGLSFYLIVTGTLSRLLASAGWQPWAWALLAAVLNMLDSLALYRAFEIGVMSVVSPISASYAAVTAVLSFLSGEAVSQLHSVGMGVVLVGVVLAATSFPPGEDAKLLRLERGRLPRGTGMAMLAAFGYGVTFWIFGFHVTPVLGGIVPVWLVRLTTPCVLVLAAPVLHQRVRIPRGRVWWYLGGVGVLDTMAFVAYTTGLARQQVAIVSVIASLYSAVTVLLAGIFLHDRLQRSQWLGIGIILLGVALVNI